MINQQLDRLEQGGSVKKVDYSEWATPIVTPLKKDGGLIENLL